MISYRGNKWTGTETISMRFSTRRFVSSSGFPCYLMLLTRWARWKRASSWSSKQKRKILEHIRWDFGKIVEIKWFCFWVFFPKRSTAHRSSDGISFQNFLFVIDDSGFRAAGVYRSLQKVLTLLCYKTFFVFVFVWYKMACICICWLAHAMHWRFSFSALPQTLLGRTWLWWSSATEVTQGIKIKGNKCTWGENKCIKGLYSYWMMQDRSKFVYLSPPDWQRRPES